MADLEKEVEEALFENRVARHCARCGKEESKEVIIAKGRLGKGPDGFFPEWLCQACLPEEKGEVYPTRYLLELVQKRNELAASSFKARMDFWKKIAAGKEEPPKNQEKPTHFAVVGTKVVAIGAADAAAIAKSGAKIFVYKTREKAEEAAEANRRKRELFEARKAGWLTIAAGEKPFDGPSKKEGDCEFPDCKRKAGDGYGVVDGRVVMLCEFCAAALFAVKEKGGCQEFAFFRGKDAMERVKRHLAWLKGRKPLAHKPFLTAINGGKK